MSFIAFLVGAIIGYVCNWIANRKEIDSLNSTHLIDIKVQFDKIANLKYELQMLKMNLAMNASLSNRTYPEMLKDTTTLEKHIERDIDIYRRESEEKEARWKKEVELQRNMRNTSQLDQLVRDLANQPEDDDVVKNKEGYSIYTGPIHHHSDPKPTQHETNHNHHHSDHSSDSSSHHSTDDSHSSYDSGSYDSGGSSSDSGSSSSSD